jgi:hypothetical protein
MLSFTVTSPLVIVWNPYLLKRESCIWRKMLGNKILHELKHMRIIYFPPLPQ